MSLDPFSLSMQAAGTALSLFGAHNQQKIMELGRQVSQAQLESNLSMIQTQSAQASENEMEQLRKNIGSQIAIQAARGTAGGAGSAAAKQQESKSTFARDERTRRLNLLSQEASLRAGNAASALSTLTSETQMGQSLTNKLFNTISSNEIRGLFTPSKKGK